MARRGRKIPLLTAKDLERVIRADGWYPVEGRKHAAFKHPTKPGKVNIDLKWRNVKVGSWVFCSVVHDQAGLTRAEFDELYWETR